MYLSENGLSILLYNIHIPRDAISVLDSFKLKIMKLNISIILIFSVIFLFVVPPVTFPHPHIFIVNRLTVVFNDEGLAGIRVKWLFDEMFSSMISGDYDQNHNGQFEESEIKKIRKEAFSYLANYDYFCFIKIDGKPFKVKYIRDFSASLNNNGKLIYEFLIPCHIKAISTFKELTIAFYDSTYYTAVFFAKNKPLSLKNDLKVEIKSSIAQNLKETYYYGMVHPWELMLKFRLKNE